MNTKVVAQNQSSRGAISDQVLGSRGMTDDQFQP
jgi:hypothetical protein